MIKLLILFSFLAGAFSAHALDRGLIHKASFDETYARFPSPYAVIEEFRRIVPQANESGYGSCAQVDKDSAPVLGTIDPMRGTSLEKKPGDLFYQYYQDCVHQIVSNGFASNSVELGKTILAAHFDQVARLAYADCMAGTLKTLQCSRFQLSNTIELGTQFWYYTPWISAGPQLKAALLDGFIDFLAGPDEVLAAQSYLGEKTAFGVPLRNRTELIALLIKKMDELANGNKLSPAEFRLVEVYADIAIILRLGPALKG